MQMNAPAIIGFLSCDAPGCGYVSADQIPLTPDVIGRPCPACGANLCTEKDFHGMYAVRAAVGGISEVMRALFGEPDPADIAPVAINYHDGVVKVTPIRREGR